MSTCLDLTGVLHRTVHVANIEEGLEEDLARTLAARAGAVEKWARGLHSTNNPAAGGDMTTLTIVFASLDSVTTALTFNRLMFAGKRLLVWQANKDKPQELLALEYKPETAVSEEEKAAAEERRRRFEAILTELNKAEGARLMGGDGAVRDDVDLSRGVMSEAQRAAFLKEHAYRQAVALQLVTEQANAQMAEVKRSLTAEIEAVRTGRVLPKVDAAAEEAEFDASQLVEISKKRPRGVARGAPVTAAAVRYDS